jgi:hypothetical protein
MVDTTRVLVMDNTILMLPPRQHCRNHCQPG